MSPRLPALFIPVLILLVLPVVAAEPRNLDDAKVEVTRYVDSGEYDRDLVRVAEQAGQYLAERLSAAPQPGQRLALIFDLDETLLSNLPHMRPLGFGYVPALWNEWVAAGDSPAIAPVAGLYRSAQARNVAIFLISDRRERDRPGTEKNLRRRTLVNFSALYLKPNESRDTAQTFKTATRKKITEAGYTIIANIGDQDSDLAGGYAEKIFKLPNPFYRTE